MSTLTLEEQAAPSTPGANRVVLYPKSDGLFYGKDDAGTERPLTDSIVINTAVATTSGTTVSLSTTIPSWAKRVTLLFNAVSTNGTNELLVQIGDSGGFETSGYVSESAIVTAAATGISTSTAGYIVRSVTATNSVSGEMILSLTGTANTWASISNFRPNTASMGLGAGIKATSATMDRVQITTVGGADAFDAGDITVTWE